LLGDTACAVGGLTVLKHAAGGVADVLDVGDGGGGDGDEAEENGGDGELHFGGWFFELSSYLLVRGIGIKQLII